MDNNLPQEVEEFKFEDWTFTFTSGQSILSSACTCGSGTADGDRGGQQRCAYCRFSTALKYSNRPDMVFHKNSLRVMHRGGASVHFDALAALDKVGEDAPESSCHVAASDVWRQARAMSAYLSNVLRTHDWTYSSMFVGDLVGFQVSLLLKNRSIWTVFGSLNRFCSTPIFRCTKTNWPITVVRRWN